ncbi:NHL repeat domain protein [hydrothermal vent metagenome]|uniref:NHL repeat domain protein n=1 Tax=hydrothermal vent metagenome TaxID=652676 RepID=A0A3B0W6S1_9ZZZZ
MYYLSFLLKRAIPLLTFVIGVFLLSACGTKEEFKPFIPPVYPMAPDKPRFVYERSLMGSADVRVLTSEEKFKAMATGISTGERGLIKPFDVSVRKGRVYVTDTVARSVVLFDIKGKQFVEFGNRGPNALLKPIGIGLSPSEEVFVVDLTAKSIHVYDKNGLLLRRFGSSEELSRPVDVAISNDGRYAYVVDTGGVQSAWHRVVKYNANTGEVVKIIGERSSGLGGFNFPMTIAIDSKDRIYVLDSGNFRVQRFNSDGKFDLTFGSVGTRLGQFSRPKGIAVDSNDNVYVMDASFANFQIFNDKGEMLMFIGQRGSDNEPGMFSLPAGITVDEDGRIYAVDQFFSKIEVFRPYGMKQGDGYAGVPPAKE